MQLLRWLAATLVLLHWPVIAQSAWDLSRHAIPLEEIQSGGPLRDGIPALLNPRFVPAGEADFLAGDDRILGVFLNGEARAYPIRILSWHELVNDRFGALPVLVSW